MKRKLSPWCKSAKHALIDQDLSTKDLAVGVNLAREYVNAVINGRAYSWQARRKISDFLGIALDDEEPSEGVDS